MMKSWDLGPIREISRNFDSTIRPFGTIFSVVQKDLQALRVQKFKCPTLHRRVFDRLYETTIAIGILEKNLSLICDRA